LALIGLQDIQEIIVFKEAHCSVGDLQVNATDALYDTLEKAVDQGLNLLNFANFKDFLQLGKEKSFFNAVSERPVLKKAFK
jgi:hypothetical protein